MLESTSAPAIDRSIDPPFVTPESALNRLFQQYSPPYILAFSGGPDSLALFARLHRAAGDRSLDWGKDWLSLAHVDHALDADSGRRARTCARLAARHQIALHQTKLQPPNHLEGGSEAWARQHRYRFLETARRQSGANWILTAHHADDQGDTLLMRILAGTRLWGLAGIQARNGRVVRPLLQVRRDDLWSTSSSPRQDALTPLADPTNRDLARTRNFIRLHLRPRVEVFEPRLCHRLAMLAQRASLVRSTHLHRIGEAFELRGKPAPTDPPSGDRSSDGGPERSATAVMCEQRHRFSDSGPICSVALGRCVTASGEFDASRLQLALEVLHRAAGAPPYRSSAFAELMRQLRLRRQARLDSGGHWMWFTDDEKGPGGLRLFLAPSREQRTPTVVRDGHECS